MTAPAPGRVVVVGSLNADLVVRTDRFPGPGETLVGGDLATLPGGKGGNQAVAAARAGGAVRLVGAVGDDAHGALLLDAAREAGVDVAHVAVRTGTATGTALITVAAGGENTIIVSPAANATLGPDDVPAGLFDGAAVLGLSLEIPLATAVHAARRARDAGAVVATNLSPYRDDAAELLALTDVLLVNEHEAAQLLGVAPDAEAERLARALRDAGPRAAVITRGAEGCVVVRADGGCVAVPAVRVDAVDTTGAGDAYTGALLTRLAAGDALVDGARFAAGVGAFAAAHHGAQPSYPTLAQLEAFLAGR
jgi:ribokinase